tara:strand:- start:6042 stop:6755 length:714 start_codon:yes stop_codon:yes gene_type:complete
MIVLKIDNKRYDTYVSIEETPFSVFLKVCGLDMPDELRDYYKIGLAGSNADEQLREWAEAYKESDGTAITNYQLNVMVELTPGLTKETAQQTRLSDIRNMYKEYYSKIAQLSIHWPFHENVEEVCDVKIGGKTYYLPSSKELHTGEKIRMGEATFEEYSDIAHLMSTSEDLDRLPLQIAMLLKESKDERYSLEKSQALVDSVKQMSTAQAANVAFFLLRLKINYLISSAHYSSHQEA